MGAAEAQHKPWVGINMNAGEFALYRAWPPEKFAVLAQMLSDRWGCRLLFTGAANEETYVSRHIKHLSASFLNLAGRTSVRQLAAVLKRLRLFISVDSGPLHLAAALGVPTIGIFGPESPRRFAPLTNGPATMLWQEPACGPCLSAFTLERRRCQAGAACVRTLPIGRVLTAAAEMLASAPGQSL
ncbi:MAG: glycosyltransferase family 9 protein [Planctomycetota bacterium]|nr:glycosyltransferase family 9 protein [Planctomycetota bacterium]